MDLNENSGLGWIKAVSYSTMLAIEPIELLELVAEKRLPDLSDLLNDSTVESAYSFSNFLKSN